jgi:hypothetical protein
MVRQRNEGKTSRNVVLKLETYKKLDNYKATLIGKKKTTSVTYDDAINDLLSHSSDD